MENTTNIPNNEAPHFNNKNQWAIPAAIVVAGALVAVSLFWTRTEKTVDDIPAEDDTTAEALETAIELSDKDHIRGNVDARIKVITYTDFECPFCKSFHDTILEVSKEYKGSDVAWIYRNFPIKSIHPKAVEEAHAAECVAELGGNDKYWQFVDRFFSVTPSNNQTDLSILPQMAVGLGVNLADFNKCMESGKYNALIDEQYNEGIATGGRGTPWSLVVTDKGQILSIDGAQGAPVVRQILDTALAE